MKLIKIDKKSLKDGIDKLKRTHRVFGPVREKDEFEFKALGDADMPDFQHYSNTRMSPKAIIYPQTQLMFTYSLDSADDQCRILQEVPMDEKPMAVFGIRPCDALAFPLVRRNFDTPEYQDTFWVRAYEASTFVGLACKTPCATCFCTSAGTGPYGKEGLDVLLAEDGDDFIAEALTPKGEALLDAAGWKAEADGGAEERIAGLAKSAEESITSQVAFENIRNREILELYEAPFWQEEAFSCINCGTCTYVCPTCWCFDIQDETYGKSGVRMRNWDTCMSPLFTLHASGHNPRTKKFERVRQRFMHKLKYYVDKYDNGIQCVGCGRCVKLCPVNIDIRRICNKMNDFDPEACKCETASS
jgi:sulfhydrogenase subunit beta (sulfur reductase)